MIPARKLSFGDAFDIAKAINEAEISMETINEVFDKKALEGTEEEQEEAGLRLFEFVIKKAPALENPLYNLLAGIANCTPLEIKNSGFLEVCELIKKIIKENKDIADFFTSAVKSAIA